MTTTPSDDTRFAFGENWLRYLNAVSDQRIAVAEDSLTTMLGVDRLDGQTFLDVGCGSGLFSLAARRLGAAVRSFDYDPQSVACAVELKRRYLPGDAGWVIEQGSALDPAYLASLGRFDVVYSWGVLHHTGAMWQALENVIAPVKPGGRLFIALYHDQGLASRLWLIVKRTYNSLPRPLRFVIEWPALLRLWGPTTLRDLLRGRPFETWRTYGQQRGMSPWWDLVDWVGGYPFEVARPEDVAAFYTGRGFALSVQNIRGGRACDEYVFIKTGA